MLRTWEPGASIADVVIDGFSMYPNPVENTLHLTSVDKIDTVIIYNMLGQEVLQSAPLSNNFDMDMSYLPSGAYLVKILTNNQIGSYHLIKE